MSIFIEPLLFKTFTATAFTIPKFAVGLFCHWCRFPYFAGVVCRSSPVRGSHVAVSRPCRLSEFNPNRASLKALKGFLEWLLSLSHFVY